MKIMKELEEIQKEIEQIRINNLKGMTQIEVDEQLYKLELSVFKAMDSVNKSGVIHDVSVSLFNEALRLMRDLAEHQNGAPLIRYEEEYNKTMTEVWDFLEANET